MKVLSIGPWPGEPVTSGTIYQNRFLTELCRSHRVAFVLVYGEEMKGAPASPAASDLEAAGFPNEGIRFVRVPARRSAVERYRAALGVLPPEAAVLQRSIGAKLRAEILAAIAERPPDVILLWNRLLASVVHDIEGASKVLHACDSSSMVLRSFAREARAPSRKALYRWYAQRHARFERRFFAGFDRIVYIAERDARAANLPPDAEVRVVANGVDAETLHPPPPGTPLATPLRIAFHGYLSSRPNADCVRRLTSIVIPDLEKRLGRGSFEVCVQGDAAPPDLHDLAGRTPSLRLLGYVEDLASELGLATVYAAPLTMGGGLKNKVLDAMACGVPVVGTPEAFSGLDVRHDREVVVTDLAHMGEELARVAKDAGLRERLGSAGRAWVLRHADWRALSRHMARVLEEACGAAR